MKSIVRILMSAAVLAAGIDVPNRASQVEDWLRRMGLLNPEAGVEIVEGGTSEIRISSIPGGIRVTPAGRGTLAVYDPTGRAALTSTVESEVSLPLDSGIYFVKVSTPLLSATRKVIVK